MLVAVISEKNTDDVVRRVNEISPDCDIIEVGFDKFSCIEANDIKIMRDKINRPVIFTLRPQHQGGSYFNTEEQRLEELMLLGMANPDYLDIEHTVDKQFIQEFHSKYPTIKIIRSYHNFEYTPVDLNAILSSLLLPDCFVYKIVTMATSSIDVLRMLHFVMGSSQSNRVIAHCMGEVGVPSRIIAPILGGYFQYTSSNDSESPAPGILSLQTCVDIYRAKENNPTTKIYAVLGDPIAQSQGHLFHNDYFRKNRINAVYVKFKIKKDELSDFFKNIKGLPFFGFSITMPLKQDVIQYINTIDSSSEMIGAINTLKIEDSTIFGLNTDGIGALDSVEKVKQISGKKVLILGAGGSARAIAFEAKMRGAASISIINRTLAHCEDLVNKLPCEVYDFHSAENITLHSFDFVFNTLPFSVEFNNVLAAKISSLLNDQTVVMDINYHSQQSQLITLAYQCGSRVVSGYEMFVEQALSQQQYWHSEIGGDLG